MKYDDASWHYGGDFPEHLPDEAGATHIGMFVCWAIDAGLVGEIHAQDFPEMLLRLKNRDLTPGAWFILACDEKFTDEDLNEQGNRFAEVYYLKDGPSGYLADYSSVFPDNDDVYSVPDTWASFEKLKPIIDSRYSAWKSPPSSGWRKWFK